jgi:hypothetical protein
MNHSTNRDRILLKFNDSFQKNRKDLSAALLFPKQHLWLSSDETSTIERLTFVPQQKCFAEHHTFHVQDFIQLPKPEDEEIDIEGLSYSDYYLWFIGSHSWKRKKPKPEHTDAENIARLAKIKTEDNRYIIGRIPLVDGHLRQSCPHPELPDVTLTAAKLKLTDGGNMLIEALKTDPHLGDFVKTNIPGKDNGFDIEGIAIERKRIFLGLRGPVLRGWAIILEIELELDIEREDDEENTLKLKSIGTEENLYKKHFIYLNGLGIRDLHRDGKDFLILAGPTMDLDGPVRVYRWQNGANVAENTLSHPEVMLEIPYGTGDDHAEGMIMFAEYTQTPSLLVIYDAPAAARLEGEGGVWADVFSYQ